MVWKYEKFKGDGAIYAFCPKCGFYKGKQIVETEKKQKEQA